MTHTVDEPGQHTLVTAALPSGPVTSMRWYRTRSGAGLLVVFRQVKDGPVVSVTFTTKIMGRLRTMRVLPPQAQG